MKILVVGSGGREHAMAWRIAQSPRVQVVYVAPGNGGTATEPNVQNIPITSIDTLIAFVEREEIALTVVGPEGPLSEGIVDQFRAKGLKIFGPTKAAAQLESSKDFAKAFMARHKIPTAKYESFSDATKAHAYIESQGAPIVVKADGLAAGKGVVVALTLAEAHAAVDDMLKDNRFGAAGALVVIEEFLAGEEASFIVMVDGQNVLALASSQDHKRLRDNDEGPNTGGMGAYSPAPCVTPSIHAQVLREIIQPTVAGLAKEGIQFTGFLYAGIMIDDKGKARTLEFNCRLGDPETQPIMARMKSDFVGLLEKAIAGKLANIEIEWDRRTALSVVMAAGGYPEDPTKGDLISGLSEKGASTEVEGKNGQTIEALVFHAGTSLSEGQIHTAGGRVLGVTGLGDSIRMAQQNAYSAVNQIKFNGMQFRTDIGYRALTKSGKLTKTAERSE
jgi:phosphoribosylamine---glycine ligase